MLAAENVPAKITNGYGVYIDRYRKAYDFMLVELRRTDLTPLQRRRSEHALRTLKQFIVYYDLTEELLDDFVTIAPDIYNELDNIKGQDGHPVDVYVRLVPADFGKVTALGVTNVAQSPRYEGIYYSEFGEHTVSVKICALSKPLVSLAHELGHVKYQVQNLVSYMAYYNKHYKTHACEGSLIGHEPDDPSGRLANVFEHMFKAQYHAFRINARRYRT